MAIQDDIKQSVISGNAPAVAELVRQALQDGLSPDVLLNGSLIPAMAEVGDLFERQEFFVPEMLIAAHAMQAGMDILRPLLVEGGIEPIGKVALGTVKGDMHDIGKNLVGMMLEGAGFEVLDLGTDVNADEFVNAVRAGADIIGMSALLTTTMANMQSVLDALTEAGVRDQVKVLVGGAPVTQAFAEQIGADGYAPDASSAANRAKSFLA